MYPDMDLLPFPSLDNHAKSSEVSINTSWMYTVHFVEPSFQYLWGQALLSLGSSCKDAYTLDQACVTLDENAS